jgi:hypothetical protein
VEHGPAPARANDFEIAGTGLAPACQYQGGYRKSKQKKDHLFLFFTFVTIASLSFWQKLHILSIPLKDC